MGTVKIYLVTITWTGHGRLAEPFRQYRWQSFRANATERQGHDDGGKLYRLPEGYEGWDGFVRGPYGTYWHLDEQDGKPGIAAAGHPFMPLAVDAKSAGEASRAEQNTASHQRQ